MRVAVYARASSRRQTSPAEQARICCELAARRGWQVVEVVQETVSTRAASMPRRAELLELARTRKIDGVLVWKLDRWGRSVADLVATLDQLAALGVAFVSATEPIDMTTPAGRAWIGMLAVFAQFERDVRAERQLIGIDSAKRAGKHLGRPARMAKRARWIRMLRADGLTHAAIAARLDVSETSVRRVLASPGARRP